MTAGTAFIGSLLAVAATVTAWPQAIRIMRTRIIAGVNAHTVFIALVTMEVWACFTFRREDWPAFASSIGPLLAWCTTLGFLGKHGHPLASRYGWGAFAIGAGVLAIAATPVWSLLGYAAGIGSAVWALPQLRTALGHEPLHGVSIPGYLLLTAENAGWIVYAILTATPAYAIGSLVQGPACAIIAGRAAAKR